MVKRGVISTISSIAREQARIKRQTEADQKRLNIEREKRSREADRAKALQAKEDRQRYLETRSNETDDKNVELVTRIEELKNILENNLSVQNRLAFESLRNRKSYSPMLIPEALRIEKQPPDLQVFLSRVKPPSFLENTLGMKGRYQRELEAAKTQFETAQKAHEVMEKERLARLAEFMAKDVSDHHAYDLKVKEHNQEVDEFEALYKNLDISAVIGFNTMILERSKYPDGFPQNFRLAYAPEPKEMVIEYELPDVSVIPTIGEYKYVKTRDVVEEKPRKPAEIKELYQDIVASVALCTIHEVLEADENNTLEVVTFNGFVKTIDLATGKDVRPCLVSVRTIREKFLEINLARVDKRVCLRNLGAQVSPQPQAMQPVKPVVEFDMVDKRFIEQGDVLSDLESRPNLMDLTPSEFELLVSNLFGKMGLETKLTRTSRDGGVDAVAFDTRPILGGKVVIQAKRYKDTVGVSAVRDLYGTMLNEGASKGIIVTTSSYGPDAYNFSKDKPLELIDGGGLLYLLEQVGIKARIVYPE